MRVEPTMSVHTTVTSPPDSGAGGASVTGGDTTTGGTGGIGGGGVGSQCGSPCVCGPAFCAAFRCWLARF